MWSERDQNFRIKADSGDQYVLKIANTLESPDVLDFQTRALQHIARTDPAMPVPRTFPDIDGNDWSLVPDQQGREHMVRLISWLEGEIFRRSRLRELLTRARMLGIEVGTRRDPEVIVSLGTGGGVE